MNIRVALLAIGLSGAVLAGCKKQEPEKPATVPPPPSAPATPAPQAAVPPSMPAPLPTIPATAPVVSESPTAAPSSPAPAGITPPAAVAATGPASDSPDAAMLLAEAKKDIDAKDWAAAGSDLKKLAAMKDQLSPQTKNQVKLMEAKVMAEKVAGKLNLPGVAAPKPGAENNK